MEWRPSDTCGSFSSSRYYRPRGMEMQYRILPRVQGILKLRTQQDSMKKAWEGEQFSAG